jgi:hypothetical protein
MSIKISKNAHHCTACGDDFQHEQTITSTVKKAEGALHREDFCQDCWHSEHNKEAYSVWNMVYHDPKVESDEPPEVFSPLRQLFYEAAEEESRIEMAKAFLAAGLLRRQKVFRLIKESDEAEGNVRVTLYTDRLGNRLIEVPDPQFTYVELEAARIRLLERLQELEAAVGPEGATAPKADSAAAGAIATAEADGTPEDTAEAPEQEVSVDLDTVEDNVTETEIVENKESDVDGDSTGTETIEEEVIHAQA